ncbi:MAG: flagellar hook-basal body complex protein FliE [Oscillospiraceae bacterium]|nr:flagellar hook-basal body complex protein FliE [Oscillospiraceae bacterium]
MNIDLISNPAYLPALTTQGQVLTPLAEVAGTGAPASFGDMLEQAIASTVSSDAEHKVLTTELLTGEDADLHTITASAQKADLMLNLTVQIRNKMVEAYQEVMRMQI